MDSIPQFFPGQLIDFKDFNRLSWVGWETQEGLFRVLFPEGAIVQGYLENLTISMPSSSQVCVASGAAFLPSGKLLIVPQSMDFDVTENFIGHSLVLYCQQKGEDFFEDPEFSDIKGFKTLVRAPALGWVAFQNREQFLKADAVELARFSDIAPYSLETQWRLWTPFFACPSLWVDKIPFFKKKLQYMASHFLRLQDIFGVYPDVSLHDRLFQLQLEIRSTPWQYDRMQFCLVGLVTEVCIYFEKILNEACIPVQEIVRDSFLEFLKTWAFLRKEGVSFYVNDKQWEEILTWDEHIIPKLVSSVRPLYFIQMLEHKLRLWECKALALQEEWVLHGFIFKKIHMLMVDAEKKYQLQAEQSHLRHVHSEYMHGVQVIAAQWKGVFLKNGAITFSVALPFGDKGPFVLVFPQLLTLRQSIVYDIFIQDKKLRTVCIEPIQGVVSMWLNVFCVVPEDAGYKKTLNVTLQSVGETPFAFFGAITYAWQGSKL